MMPVFCHQFWNEGTDISQVLDDYFLPNHQPDQHVACSGGAILIFKTKVYVPVVRHVEDAHCIYQTSYVQKCNSTQHIRLIILLCTKEYCSYYTS